MSEIIDFLKNTIRSKLQIYANCIFLQIYLCAQFLTDLRVLTRFCSKLIYTCTLYDDACLKKSISQKNSIGNCTFMQHAFFCKYVCAHGFD